MPDDFVDDNETLYRCIPGQVVAFFSGSLAPTLDFINDFGTVKLAVEIGV